VVVVSAHWEDPVVAVSAAAEPATIHDFRGFPPELYRIRYPAPGAPALAGEIAALVAAAGLPVRVDPDRGLDHGAWVPMALLYPDADIPALQVSVNPQGGPDWHLRLGRALRPLRERGAMILASGNLTHNLRELRWDGAGGAATPDWVSAFEAWMAEAIEQGRAADLVDYRRLAPHAARNHPTEEHLLPLFAAVGSGLEGVAGRRVHASHTFGVLAMDCYAFD
jgi:4,5-DOPA dioxygenase extradiol